MQKVNRQSHVGKNPYEKEAYRQFLSKRFELDKTEEDQENPLKTDASTFERDLPDTKSEKPREKSFSLKLQDFFKNNWVVTILGGIVVLIIGGAFTMVVKQNVQEEKIANVEKRTSAIETKVDSLSTGVSSIGSSLEVFKVEINKDFQYLREMLGGR